MESPAEFFWDYAIESGVFKKVLVNLMTNAKLWDYFVKYPFPYEKIPYKSKVIIYAAGTYGKTLVRFLKASKYAELVLWVDRNWAKMNRELGVKPVEEIVNVKFDFLIIAVENEKTANEIKEALLKMQLSANKLVWNWNWY